MPASLAEFEQALTIDDACVESARPGAKSATSIQRSLATADSLACASDGQPRGDESAMRRRDISV